MTQEQEEQEQKEREIQLKSILNQIDEFLLVGDVTSYNLWNLLTALRGPDSEDDELKEKTTAVIRAALFPKTASSSPGSILGFVKIGFIVNKVDLDIINRFNGPSLLDHFYNHIDLARRTLRQLNINPWKKDDKNLDKSTD